VVAERGTSSVVRISGNEPHERTVIAAGLGVPVGLAARGGDLWVSDWATGMVLQLAADGKVLAQPVCVANGFDYPEGLAVDANGDLLVVEPENGRLRRIDVATREVTTVVEGLTPCLQGDHPTWVFNGVAVGPSGRIYLTNDATNTVCVVGSNR
jgi:sugar lactone lactonase YvrE